MTDCIFCKIIKKEIPAEIIYENEDFVAIVDLKPDNFGHSLLIPKEHAENIYTIQNATLNKLGGELQKISIAVKKAVAADGVNIHMNNEPAAGQVVFHAHFHIIPRFINDGLIHFQTKAYEYPDQIKEIGEKIRKAIL
ncbi:HIT family protein [Patescibacteria group bacterium]|nr:HIT family protein [Patescibacteria group bacterium]